MAREEQGLTYDAFSELAVAQEINRGFVKQVGIRPGDAVLDIGCGHGNSVEKILEALRTDRGWEGQIVAIDPDPVALSFARRRFGPEHPIEFAECSAQDLDRLGFPDGAFDVSVFANGIHYLRSQDDFMRALRAVRRITSRTFALWSAFVKEAYVGKTPRFAGLWVAKAYELLGVDSKARSRSENLQERDAGGYVAALRQAGFSHVEHMLATFDLPPEVYEAIARFRDYVRNALPDIPSRPDITIELRSEKLFAAVRLVYERLGVAALPRNWLYVRADV